MSITQEAFGATADGTAADIFTLASPDGFEARITNYGGIVVSLTAPDREGSPADVVLGYETLAEYIADSPYFGALVGRYGNRIGGAKFTLDGVEYPLAVNDGENSLHGGIKGFDKVVWQAETDETDAGPALTLRYDSADGEEGYPGNLSVQVVYTWTAGPALRIDYTATTDKPTPLNPTHHSYFNLAGAGEGDILSHEMTIAADRFTPVDGGLIPTGELRPVVATPMDFRAPTPIGARIGANDEQLKLGGGYDHNWVLNNTDGSLTLAARVVEPASGRVMEVLTTEPGIQFYSGNFLDGDNVGKGGKAYEHRTGLCLETQHFPDSPNRPEFPTTILQPGQTYTQTTVYRFATQ